MNANVATNLHAMVVQRLSQYHESPLSRDQVLVEYVKKVLDHLVLLEEEIQELYARNDRLSKRISSLGRKRTA